MPFNKNKKILALIPARGGSEEVVNKNLRYYLGRTLLSHTIYTAKQSQYIDRIVVCTDDKDIQQEGLRAGAEVVMLPDAISAAMPVVDSIVHSLGNLPAVNDDEKSEILENFSAFILLQVTSPLREAVDIDSALEFYFSKSPAGACVSMTLAPASPYWMFRQAEDSRLMPVMTDTLPSLRRQDLPKIYSLNGAIYIADPAWYLQHRSFLTAGSIAFEMPKEKSLDIKTEYDFQILDLLTRNAAAQRQLIGAGLLKRVATTIISDYLDKQEEESYGVKRATELRTQIRKVKGSQPESLQILSNILIDFIMHGKTASDHEALSFFRSFHRASGTGKDSLRGMFIEKFIQPVLGSKKSLHFLQTPDETRAYFKTCLQKISIEHTMSLPSALGDKPHPFPETEALRL
jgi:CMP-N,N'-diacetyllegionaminic acid synthase